MVKTLPIIKALRALAQIRGIQTKKHFKEITHHHLVLGLSDVQHITKLSAVLCSVKKDLNNEI